MGTIVNYNSVVLKNVLTLEYAETPHRDPSDTDLWYKEVFIRVLAIVNVDLLTATNPNLGTFGVGGDNIDNLMANVLCRLNQDRKDLSYSIDGDEVVGWSVTSVGPDHNNGPKVIEARMVHINSKTVHIIFAVRVAGICCRGVSPSANPIANHRWSVGDDIDDNWKTTRVWRGLLRLKQPGKVQISPHVFRQFCFPPLARGFKRKRMNFTASVNGLELAYEIADEEMIGQAAPWPAVKMKGHYSETVELDASTSIGECHIRLDGPKGDTSDPVGNIKRQMIERAMQIIEQKFRLRSAAQGAAAQILMLHLREHIGEDVNAIEALGRVRHVITEDASSGIAAKPLGSLLMAQMGEPLKLPDYDDGRAMLLGPFGTASFATLFACFLQDPCNPPAFFNLAQSEKSPSETKERKEDQRQPPSEVTYKVGSTGTVAGYGRIPYSDEHTKNGIYTFAQVDTVTRKNPMHIGLPIALSREDEKNNKLDTMSVVRLGAAVSQLVVRISLERNANWPQILKDSNFKDSNNITYSLVSPGSVYNTRAPKVTQAGDKKFYALDAEYVFAMSRPLRGSETFPVGSLPWDSGVSRDNKMKPPSLVDPDYPKGIA